MNLSPFAKPVKVKKDYPSRTGTVANVSMNDEDYEKWLKIKKKKRFTNRQMQSWLLRKVK